MEKRALCVSLGAGRPEEITLRALRALQGADIIYVPTTGHGRSRAKDCLEQLGLALDRVREVYIPMETDRCKAHEAYSALADEMAQHCAQGQQLAITTVGDAGIYSTVQRVASELSKRTVALEYVSGVPSFVAAAARCGVALVSGDETLVVHAHVEGVEALSAELAHGDTVVLMKLSRYAELLPALIAREQARSDFYYVENLGVRGEELLLTSPAEILAHQVPYFSLLIIKPKGE